MDEFFVKSVLLGLALGLVWGMLFYGAEPVGLALVLAILAALIAMHFIEVARR